MDSPICPLFCLRVCSETESSSPRLWGKDSYVGKVLDLPLTCLQTGYSIARLFLAFLPPFPLFFFYLDGTPVLDIMNLKIKRLDLCTQNVYSLGGKGKKKKKIVMIMAITVCVY